MATVTMGMAMLTTAMTMLIMATATVITGMAIRTERPAGIPPGHLIQADTRVGMPGQVEDLRAVKLAESDNLADTVGLWPQRDIRADQPPLGGVKLVRRK